jgi:hypothetical protein
MGRSQRQALAVASPILNAGLAELDLNAYHTHALRPEADDDYRFALHVRNLFGTYGQVHPAPAERPHEAGQVVEAAGPQEAQADEEAPVQMQGLHTQGVSWFGKLERWARTLGFGFDFSLALIGCGIFVLIIGPQSRKRKPQTPRGSRAEGRVSWWTMATSGWRGADVC